MKQALYGRLFFTALLVMATCASALAYGWGGVLAVRHLLDVGTVVALVSYLSRLYGPLLGLSNVQVSIMTALVSFERVFEVLDLPPMIREKPEAVAIPPGPARISFDHVSFRYPSAAEVSLASLESIAVPDKRTRRPYCTNISFEVEPGQLVALVGPSGAGKTTITQLVPRLYDVQSGSIRINGIDVREATARLFASGGSAWSHRMLICSMTPFARIFSTQCPVQRTSKSGERCAMLRSWDLIESLPDKLDTLVGERGYRFSGGEKQRIAIARLLLKAPDIVILDEATAHLDSESEAAVQRALETALAGRTSIVIAHRLSTILKADEILVVQRRSDCPAGHACRADGKAGNLCGAISAPTLDATRRRAIRQAGWEAKTDSLLSHFQSVSPIRSGIPVGVAGLHWTLVGAAEPAYTGRHVFRNGHPPCRAERERLCAGAGAGHSG